MDKLHVAALIDLPRSAQSGGHVKCWERLAAAAATENIPLDLTVYFSGDFLTETLGPQARIRQIPPVFSTSNLKFLPYTPDYTDLAPYHPRLARELSQYDVIHTTDGFFAFARTAEKVSKKFGIPLVTSFHTDTLSYAEIFTRQTIEHVFGEDTKLGSFMLDTLKLPERQRKKMERRLSAHVRACSHALVTRAEDHEFAEKILGKANVSHLRLGADREMFGPHRKDREGVNRDYNIPPNMITALFVGRLDVGKNIYTLISAAEKLIAEGVPLHIITAGIGPAEKDLKQRLGNNVSVLGFVSPTELARLYASVDFLALTSEVEIRSMAGVEAMASGCPVLVSEKSGIADLFQRTSAMRVVNAGIENWTDALREFASDPKQRDNMRAAAIDYGEKHLASWHDVLDEDLFSIWKRAKAGN
ncbi:MAG: glycosyltransferase [Alphaproteobacteria bacterium]|nr:glycosyltransferase [Alphaproteobacteria bacterium]